MHRSPAVWQVANYCDMNRYPTALNNLEWPATDYDRNYRYRTSLAGINYHSMSLHLTQLCTYCMIHPCGRRHVRQAHCSGILFWYNRSEKSSFGTWLQSTISYQTSRRASQQDVSSDGAFWHNIQDITALKINGLPSTAIRPQILYWAPTFSGPLVQALLMHKELQHLLFFSFQSFILL